MLAVILVLDFCDLISIIFSFIIVYYKLSFCRFEKGAYPKDLQTCCIASLDLQFCSNSLYVSHGDTSDENQKGRNLIKCLPKSALQQNEQKQVLRKLSNRRRIHRAGSKDRTAVDSVDNDNSDYHIIVCFTIMDILSDTIRPLHKYGAQIQSAFNHG